VADYKVLPGGKVRIDSWFDLTVTDEPPKGARVQVFRRDGSLLTEGRLDDKGVFVFPFEDGQDLRVVVSAGAGHRTELSIPGKELRRTPPSAGNGPSHPDETATSPATPLRANRSPRDGIKDLLVGVGFLLAVAAFVLSLRNLRQLQELKRAVEERRGAAHGKDEESPAAGGAS
jgi:hypothetical protein